MYKKLNDWLSFVTIDNNFPFALTYEYADNIKPIVSISTFNGLLDIIKICIKHNYDYDFTIGNYHLNNDEFNELCVLTGV